MSPEALRRRKRREKVSRYLNGERYFGREGSVLTAEDIFDAADACGVSPYLFAAIVAVESAWGSSEEAKWSNNFTGIKGVYTKLRAFGSVAEGLRQGASLLKRRYWDKGLITPEQIGPVYAPVKGATNDDLGLNSNWVRNVRAIMDSCGRAATA